VIDGARGRGPIVGSAQASSRARAHAPRASTPRLASWSRSEFAVEGVSEALCALVAVIGTAGQRAGRPSGDLSREGGRALLMFARAAAFRANFKKGARGR
jgi:hypothetical protein